ncbi:AGAP006688-PA [Anopheles gambiae str. PEST]|uniref:Signal recognition particle receptor subunit beta n=1 Tax=Anopheles gambiae TaxID=7165 RepID=Q7Q513_ANOGA|nr:signal recognition particle receptor subunit beta [Anopheles gambiae]EAA11816.2 AGAP006688-PA [Anopheles gambiae str. PEST]
MDKADRKSSARASIKLGELNYTPVLIALAVVLLTIVVLFLWKRKKTVRSAVLFTGLCDSGKTYLFAHLCLGGARETFTSIKENVGSFKTERGRVLKMVDVPGNERLRGKFFDEYKNIAKAIVYMIDSVTVQKDIRDVADFLYTILVDKATSKVPVVVLCNKQDETLAKTETAIKSMLEKEINIVRQTRRSQLQSVDNSSSSDTFLGKSASVDFEFEQLGQRVRFVPCSAMEEQFAGLTKFLDTL